MKKKATFPAWVRKRNTLLAKDYQNILRQKRAFAENSPQMMELERKISAVQSALEALPDEISRELIRQNMFKRVPMNRLDLPMSITTMKRIRTKFVYELAKRMNEV